MGLKNRSSSRARVYFGFNVEVNLNTRGTSYSITLSARLAANSKILKVNSMYGNFCNKSPFHDFSIKPFLLIFYIILIGLTLHGCGHGESEVSRIEAHHTSPTIDLEPGEHALGLGGLRWVNRGFLWRDGILYIPKLKKTDRLPLLIWMHEGGGKADSFKHLFPIAEELGIVILALDARHNTWDGIDSPFGPDVKFIEQAMQHIFERVAIDPDKIALGGLSDGASYALALGRSNGDLFTHLIAVAPWRLAPPSPPVGKPKILVAHGIRDNVYPVYLSRLYTVPELMKKGFDVSYFEFDGPHWITVPVARKAMQWFVDY